MLIKLLNLCAANAIFLLGLLGWLSVSSAHRGGVFIAAFSTIALVVSFCLFYAVLTEK